MNIDSSVKGFPVVLYSYKSKTEMASMLPLPVAGVVVPWSKRPPKQPKDPSGSPTRKAIPLSLVPEELTSLQNQFQDIDQQMNKLEVELSNLMHQWGISERPEGHRPHAETLKDGQKIKYRLYVPLGSNVLPENVSVCVSEADHKVKIETRREELYDHGNSRLYQEVLRQFKLPKAVDVPELKSVLNPNGDLVIEAPVMEKDGAFREPVPVPVKFESSL